MSRLDLALNVWSPHHYGDHIVTDDIVATATIYPWSEEEGTDCSTILHSVDLTEQQLNDLLGVTEVDDEWLVPNEHHLTKLNYEEAN